MDTRLFKISSHLSRRRRDASQNRHHSHQLLSPAQLLNCLRLYTSDNSLLNTVHCLVFGLVGLGPFPVMKTTMGTANEMGPSKCPEEIFVQDCALDGHHRYDE
jgi:hypothetical protein